MELNKGKYKKAEVEQLLEQNALIYREEIQELLSKVAELSNENKTLKNQNETLKNKEDILLQAITNTEKASKKNEKVLALNYSSCVNTLKAFSIKWAEYFDYLIEKYPYYPAIKQADELKSQLDDILKNETDDKVATEKLKKSLKKAEKNSGSNFSPKEKIQEYIAVTTDNGFNLDEVLNPGNLNLEDLCKELGLLEEND